MENYNGWSNYETWLTYNWLTSDEGIYRNLMELVNETKNEIEDKEKRINEIWKLSKEIETFTLDLLECKDNLFLSDVVNCFVQEVNFHEIAESLLEE